uniref:Uncharacterized protein n=1 Tax=Anguilla anguilla TaxID=7936 RepID=A0A0E9V7K3_ANGAN
MQRLLTLNIKYSNLKRNFSHVVGILCFGAVVYTQTLVEELDD